MWQRWIPFWQPGDSEHASDVDLLFTGLTIVSFLVLALLAYLLITFAVRYRAGSGADRDHRIKKSWHWEVAWTAATLIAFLALFVWGAHLYFGPYQTARCRSTSSPSSGCGRCSIPAASARSTSCTFRSRSRSG
jgi:cytochrome c oxidase subunit 2